MTSAQSIIRLLLCLLTWLPVASHAQQAKDDARPLTVGFVELEDDPRYVKDNAYTGIEFRTLGRPYPGAVVGIADAQATGRFVGIDFGLEKFTGASSEELAKTVRKWSTEQNVHFVLADLPPDALLELANATADLPVLYFNVSAPEDSLRGAQCQANIAHTYPSYRMLTDALVQYLVAQKWTDLLVLAGEREADSQLVRSLKNSATKFGASVVAERPFVLSKNPRNRNENNITLLTSGESYDAVFVADTSGELGRYVPYQTRLPRPVVGTAGLEPHAWHWSWHRHGAPQLQHRFEELAMPRRMNSASWAAWVAVKGISQAAMRADGDDFQSMRTYLLGSELNLDGAKGNPSSFRSWNQQLRQPLLLASPNAVIARAPLPEFLHEVNDLDTLGVDRPESECQLQ